MRLTPPRRARRRMAGLVIPWIESFKTRRNRFAPPFPRPLPPLPLPEATPYAIFYRKRGGVSEDIRMLTKSLPIVSYIFFMLDYLKIAIGPKMQR